MPVNEFLEFAVSASASLIGIHRNNAIHSDIRPANISWDSKTKICELTEPVTAETQLSLLEKARLPYISPEQTGRMNRRVDFQTDLYSLGVIFYELLTGNPPFKSEDPLQIIHSHIARHPQSPHEQRVEIPQPISAIVMRLLEKNAEARYQSALGLQHDLNLCATQLVNTGKIETFQLGESDLTGRFSIPQKLYGREREIASLLDSFERISQGRKELLLVAGYSGVGKSMLVHEIHKPITTKHGLFIEGKFDQYQRSTPYFAWGQAFSRLVSQLLMESDSRLDEWKVQILQAVGLNGKLIIDLIPNLELVIGPQPDVPELDGQAMQNRFNYAFQRFIKVIARPDHPLVVFLDDLQWIDTASLNLMASLLSDPELTHFLVVGAYRDNEVYDAHPLMLELANLQEAGINQERMSLQPLLETDINALCAETLHCTQAESQPLAQQIYSKTGGNAFFSHQMLHFLYEEHLLTFDHSKKQWQWDIDELIKLDISDNVIDLMIAKVLKLPAAAQEILQLASCIGNQFDRPILTLLTHKPEQAVQAILQALLRENILIPDKELYKFAHDRIQQAIYSIIDPDLRTHIQRRIGFSLVENTSPDEINDKVFDIVSHLNQALDTLHEKDERLLVAELNLKAGQKAKAGSAFVYAKEYIETALQLLDEACWQNQYDLTLSLHNENAHLAALTGQFEQIETTSEIIEANARNTLDLNRIYMVRIEADMLRYNFPGALQVGLKALKDLEVDIPFQPSQEDYTSLKERLIELVAQRPEKNWAELPDMTDETALAISVLLASEMSTSFISHPPIYSIVSYRSAILTLEYGVSPWSPFAFMGVASAEVFLADPDSSPDEARAHLVLAAEMKQIACELMDKPITAPSRTKATMIQSFASVYLRPIEEAIELSKASYLSGYETGDMLYGGYGIYVLALNRFGAGMELAAYQSQLIDFVNLYKRMGQIIFPTWLSIFTQTAQNFMEHTPEPDKLQGAYFDEEAWLPEALAINDMSGRHIVFVNKLILAYLFDVDNKLDEYIREVGKVIIGGRATYSIAEFYFYASLSKLRLAENQEPQEQQQTLSQIDSYLQLVKIWSGFVPSTFQHKYDLIAAEKAGLTGDLEAALFHYEQAICGAQTNGFLHEEALGNELFARFWLERNNHRLAGPLLDKAHLLYRKWGAMAKAEHLAQGYSEWMTQQTASAPAESESPTEHMAENLDLRTVLKASQAISGEIELDKLLAKMMNIVIENAGAQKGFLILAKGDEWRIEAMADVDKSNVQVLQSTRIDANNTVSAGIIHYVARTQEIITLADAANKGGFTDDPDIRQHRPKSILCVPLEKKGKVSGIVYLENNLTTGAFIPERVEVLSLLSSQMALALDNAHLYADIIEREERFHATFEQAAVGIAHVSPGGKFLRINQKFCNIVGYSHEEMLKLTFPEITHPDDLEVGCAGLFYCSNTGYFQT